ncbi:MAG: hydrogenase formation protein HypD [Firmicutes bacterium]|nr:hydrogenase formation protein HypD [Bacillota bacterium]
MKYRDEFAREDLAEAFSRIIKDIGLTENINLMEVCGTHTHSIAKYGIRDMLPPNIRLLSGPGCPVCVTPNLFIDQLTVLAEMPGVIITTFGDMVRVPGSFSSLQETKGRGADVRICYSPDDAVRIAEENPDKKVVFAGVGFETTAPGVAAAIIDAGEKNLSNFFVLAGFKTLPNALRALAQMPDLNLNGLICPGHLSVVTGTSIYREMAEVFKIPCVISGFEALDILETIRLLLLQISEGRAEVENGYSRVVRDEGNPKAMAILGEVFRETDSVWRGIGNISSSGLVLNEKYSRFDALNLINVNIPAPVEPSFCICGQILTGVKTPADCPGFGKACTPDNPAGACMVSSEGACAAWYRFGRNIE